LLNLYPQDDAYVRRFQSLTGSLEDITSITNHFFIGIYALPAYPDMLHCGLYTRDSSPEKYWWHRLSVESLYNTNWVDGTREKWTEKYYCPFGLMSALECRNDKVYTMMGDLIYNWARYDIVKRGWEYIEHDGAFFYTWIRNSDRSLVVVNILKYQMRTETYWYENEHMVGGVLIPYYESPHTIVYDDRVLEIKSFAISHATDVKAVDFPTGDNVALSNLIKACYAYAYTQGGVTDPKADILSYCTPYIAS
ncbi:MAG: hypothetical protein JW902_15425, partial [Syntrophaceae bacterium]|nr:hypothetical protein [Syntrophaceae bacterium]